MMRKWLIKTIQLESFEDFAEVDSSIQGFEVVSDEQASAALLYVKGRLRAHVGFWEEVHAPSFIIECIREGSKIPFYSTPSDASFRNYSSALAHADFVVSLFWS